MVGDEVGRSEAQLLGWYLLRVFPVAGLAESDEEVLGDAVSAGLDAGSWLQQEEEELDDSTGEELGRLVSRGDEASRVLFEAYLPVVVRVAVRHLATGRSLLELMRGGHVALWSAIKEFDWQSGESFGRFAEGVVGRALTEGSSGEYPRDIPAIARDFEGRASQVVAAVDWGELMSSEPAVLAESLGVSLEVLGSMLDRVDDDPVPVRTSNGYQPAPGNRDDDESEQRWFSTDEVELEQRTGSGDWTGALAYEAESINADLVEALLETLDMVQQKVLLLRFGLFGFPGPLPPREIAELLGISEEMARETESEALVRLAELVSHLGSADET